MLENGNERAQDDNQQGQGDNASSLLFSQVTKLGLFVVLSGGLFYGVLSLVQPQYSSTAMLQLEQATGKAGEGKSGMGRAVVREQIKVLHSKKLVQNFIARNNVAKDPEFNGTSSKQGPLRRVLIMLGLAFDPATLPAKKRIFQAFNHNLSVEEGQKAKAITIAMRSSDPAKSAQFANLYAKDYIARLNEQARVSRPAPRKNNSSAESSKLRQAISAGKSELAVLQDDIRINLFVASEKPIIEQEIEEKTEKDAEKAEGAPAEKLKLSKDQLFELTTQYILARAGREQIEVRINLVRAMLSSEGEIHATSTVLNSGAVQRLLRKRSRLERRKSDLEVTLLPSHPQLKRLNRELTALRTQIKSEAQSAVANLENEAKIAAAKEKSIKESIDKLQKPVVAVEEKATPAVDATTISLMVSEPIEIDERLAKLDALQRKITDSEQQLASVQARDKREASQAARLIPAMITARMISKAMAVNDPVFPQKVPMTLLGMLAAFFLGLMPLLFGSKKMDDRELVEENREIQMPPEQMEEEDLLGFGQSAPVNFGAKPIKV